MHYQAAEKLRSLQTLGSGRLKHTAEKLAHACSSVEERPFRAAKAVPKSVPASAAVETICRAGAFFRSL